MDVNQYVLVQGARRTRGALTRWRDNPWPVLRSWVVGGVAVAIALLFAVWLIASLAPPDLTPRDIPGVTEAPTTANVLQLLFRNSLVLALHAFACVAGFIAGSSLPMSAANYKGWWRWVHDKAGPLAIGFVIAATLFSLTTQAYILGFHASTLAFQLHMSPALLLVGLLPHAVPELFALFLPLAAWTIASRRGEWHELLAATFVTVAIAIPILIAAAAVE